MLAEGELRSNLDDTDKVRELQDKVAELKAEVTNYSKFMKNCVEFDRQIFTCESRTIKWFATLNPVIISKHSYGFMANTNFSSSRLR